MNDSNTKIVDEAIRLARMGIEVFPCAPGGKTPMTQHGFKDATTDEDVITSWWSKTPDANLAVRPPENILILDVDPRSNGGQNLLKLSRQHEGLPETWMAHTGSAPTRGLHIWLIAGTGPWRGHLCEGVDLKARNGYVIVPPSIHPSGQKYLWGNDLLPAMAPPWVIDLAKVKPPAVRKIHKPGVKNGTGKPGDGLLHWMSQQASERHNSLRSILKAAHADGWLDDRADDILDAARATGLPDAEILGLLDWYRGVAA